MADIAFLLGAGASVDAGLPTSWKLTEHIEAELHPGSRTMRVLRFVAAELIAEEGRRGRTFSQGVDIERVLTAIELLAERSDLEISPFVHSWNPQVEIASRSNRMLSSLVQDIQRNLASSFSHGLERPLREFVEEVAGSHRKDSEGSYQSAFDELQVVLVRILSKFDSTDYLQPILDYASESKDTTIATLNYDLTVEHQAALSGTSWSTGIDSWIEGARWSWSGADVKLLKLHGSINWESVLRRTRDEDTLPQYRLRVLGDEVLAQRPAIVFGGRSKLRAEGPTLDLLAEFALQIRSARTLVVVGYSFRDDHVNEVITRWVNANNGARLVIVDPHFDASRKSGSDGNVFRSNLYSRLDGGGPIMSMQPSGPLTPGRIASEPRDARLLIVRRGALEGLPAAIEAASASAPWPSAEFEGK